MTVFNLGSINADHFYDVPHLPRPGETLAATRFFTGLGGKGTNQSVAAAKAGSEVRHIGAVGSDGSWAVEKLRDYGVNTDHIALSDKPTGHAIINVDAAGENAIVIYAGANRAQSSDNISRALAQARRDDLLLVQNETDKQEEAAQLARKAGARVIYSAAPFSVDSVRAVLPFASILMMNAVESDQLCAALETKLESLSVDGIVVTRGHEGAEWIEPATGNRLFIPAIPVTVVDTTGAGDTFAGYFAAGLDRGHDVKAALTLASAAAALKITRQGTADVIPSLDEVMEFIAGS